MGRVEIRSSSNARPFATLALLLAAVAGCANPPAVKNTPAAAQRDPTETSDTARTDAWFDAHRDQPPSLRMFLQRMPKGGDIHSHLGGAVYAESYLEWAAEEGFCVREDGERLEIEKCVAVDSNATPLSELSDSRIYNRLIDEMSIRNQEISGQAGHGDFFSSFETIAPVSRLRAGRMVAEVAARAADQRTYYLELLITLQSRAVRELGRTVGLRSDFASTHGALLEAGLADLVDAGREELNALEREFEQAIDCEGVDPSPACEVTVRFLQQASRTKTPAEVFAQLAFAVAIANADPRVVGINLISPEDDRVALRDYTLHMEMLKFLVSTAPEPVNVALHAGELTLGLVHPRELRFHIREAIEIGQARRIGHGVDIAYEHEPMELLELMRDRGILVEVCLTSNDVILGVRGDEHPLPLFLEAGVPVTLATDDEGVARIDLTHEYLRAALTYDLGYRELKGMARNSLAHSFLPGPSLWRTGALQVVEACEDDSLGSESPTRACAAFLASSERAREQWGLEAEFVAFEALSRRAGEIAP